eukprot:2287514-Prymnesium_polylepis.1
MAALAEEGLRRGAGDALLLAELAHVRLRQPRAEGRAGVARRALRRAAECLQVGEDLHHILVLVERDGLELVVLGHAEGVAGEQ